MDIHKIKRKIDKNKIVSFDIFDTLIKRMVKNPHDVFSLVEKIYNLSNQDKISNFRNNRISAERECRKFNNTEEVNLKEIYKYLSKTYSNKQLRLLKEKEEEIEKNICKFNHNLKDIYKYCRDRNKTIIITSDMYLSKKIIISILETNNIKYDKLYLSSEINATKNTGNLFKYILKDLRVKPQEILHIGDNKKSDFLSPKKLGIRAILWKNSNSVVTKNNKIDNLTKNIIESFLDNSEPISDDIFLKIGFNYFGPLLLCFSKWLLDELNKAKIKNAFFFSRDGYIMKKAFDIINTGSIRSDYFLASRRAIITPSFKKCADINSILSSMHISESIKIKSLFKKMGLDDLLNNEDLLDELNIDIEKEEKLSTIVNNKTYKQVFKKLYPYIIENSKKEYKAFFEYKKEHNFTGKIAIIDIGWFGNMQHALEKLKLDTDIYGYYMGIEPRNNYQKNQKMSGFIFETGRNYDYFLKEHNFNAIFEMLFLGQHGSVKRYTNNKEGVEFYEYEYKDSKELDNIIKLQNSAIKFIEEFNTSGLIGYLTDDMTICFERLAECFINPTLKTASCFGDMSFFDDEKMYIAKPKRIHAYLNIKKFIQDYKHSMWKIGFLKRVFKIKLPYYRINMFIRNCYIKRKG